MEDERGRLSAALNSLFSRKLLSPSRTISLSLFWLAMEVSLTQ
jgi:hypothetical protein